MISISPVLNDLERKEIRLFTSEETEHARRAIKKRLQDRIVFVQNYKKRIHENYKEVYGTNEWLDEVRSISK